MARIEEKEDGEIDVSTLYDIFEKEMADSGHPVSGRKRALIEHLTSVFPKVKKQRQTGKISTRTFYQGISLKPQLLNETKFNKLSDIKQYLPPGFAVITENDECSTCQSSTGFYTYATHVCKNVTFFKNRKWSLSVDGKDIDLHKLDVSEQFIFTKESIQLVCEIVNKLRMCVGRTFTKKTILTRFHTLQYFMDGSVKRRILKPIMCERLVSMTSKTSVCHRCIKMTIQTVHDDSKENVKPVEPQKREEKQEPQKREEKQTLSAQVLRSLIPDLTDEMAELFLSQAQNVGRDPRGRRWPEKMIITCLQWYCRSPQSYEAFRSTNMMVLPCPSTLILYKNRVKHDIGFDEELMKWMYSEAMRKDIHEDGWKGGLIIDEMSIQADLQISKCGDVVELCGFADAGDIGNSCTTLRTGKKNKVVGTYALQFVFLGLTGFRFPFAHFITNGIQGTELYGLFWEAVDKLQKFGFYVLYTSLDGAQSNRNFMKYNLQEKSTSFKTVCPCNFNEVVFIMDVSHVIKKIRNGVHSSGIGGKIKQHTRLLRLPSGHTVQWQMFCDCFYWDKGNSLQLHRKLTKEHIILTTHTKMRNHLAEDVLNSDMLNTMKVYQSYLGTKGHVLNGAIELLENTSKIVAIFRDMRPITHLEDERLNELFEVSKWFKSWKEHAERTSKGKKAPQECLSYQCFDDLQSCILGFIDLCKIVIHSSKEIFVTPALVNSDVVENLFNQQRSTYNGANANPNALQYRKSLNSVILGQKLVSRKANAGRGRDAAIPFDHSMKTLTTKKRKFEG